MVLGADHGTKDPLTRGVDPRRVWLPLESIEDGALRSSKSLDTHSNGVTEKMSKYTAKQQEVETALGRGKNADMDNELLNQDWRHIGARGSVIDGIGCDLEEKEVGEEEAELEVVKGEMAEEGTGKGGNECGGRGINPISQLNL